MQMSTGNVTSAGWQVTLCDPMWHVSSRSGVATLRTAIHLLLTVTSYADRSGRFPLCSVWLSMRACWCRVGAVAKDVAAL